MTFTEAFKRLKSAKCPEDIFGWNGDVDETVSQYRTWAKVVHPDKANGEKHATEAFQLLEYWNGEMVRKMGAKTYGDYKPSFKAITIKTKRQAYEVTELLAEGDLCNVYQSGDYVLKVVRSAANNDLARNEAVTLKKVHERCKNLPIEKHIPDLFDSFTLDKRQVTVLGRLKGYCTLVDIIGMYPDGLDLADAAWMFNRILAALASAHYTGIVHGAVLPGHVMVNTDHNGVLVDWCYSVPSGSPLKAIVPAWDMYPPELLKKKPVDIGADCYMASKCLEYLLGENKPPRRVQGLIRACQLGAAYREKNVLNIHKEFGEILVGLYGKRKFRHLAMPITTTKG